MAAPRPVAKSKLARLFPRTWAGRCACACAAWAVLMTAGFLLNDHATAVPPTDRPLKKTLGNFVSADSCRSCHPGNYSSWHASYHRSMTQLADAENFAANMDGLRLSAYGHDYLVERSGDRHFVRVKAQDQPDSAFGPPKEIVLLTGSHNMQVCWTAVHDGRTLEQFPFAYLIAEKQWVPVSNSFLMPPDLTMPMTKGDWNFACINCHVTKGRSRMTGENTFDSDVSDFGISCEACHAGGREHVVRNRDPLRRFALHLTGESDPTIANPAKMDGPTAAMVCGQCHSVWDFTSQQAHASFLKNNDDYEPGHKKFDLRYVPQPAGAGAQAERERMRAENPGEFQHIYWGDGMVRATGREYNGTTASPCFKGGRFSCLSCHQMHPAKTDPASLKTWADNHQMGPGMDTNQACLQCHGDMAARLTAHTHHAADSAGSSCYNCHMPHTSFGLLRGIRSHEINSPSVHETIAYHRPNACNLCHLDRTLAWTADKLHQWYGQPIPAMSRDDRELALGAQWILKGDAQQRALIAWSMGWAPAQRAAGYQWLYPFLIFELNDPYPAVRFVSWKSLQTLPGFTDFQYDYNASDARQKEVSRQAYDQWWRQCRDPQYSYRWETLLQPSGQFDTDAYNRLLNERDHRTVRVIE